jgi:hypothetical protein
MTFQHTRATSIACVVAFVTLASSAQAGWIQDTTYTNLWVGDDAHSGLVYDASQELTWLLDANLFLTQSAGGTGVRDAIISDIGSVGAHTLSTSDFDIGTGRMSWWGAMAWAQWLDYGGWDDWRLWSVTDLGDDGCPTVSYDGTDCGYNIDTATSELGHLWYDTLGNTAAFDTGGNSRGTGNFGLTQAGPFQNFDEWTYWSDTEYEPNTNNAWFFSAFSGVQFYLGKVGLIKTQAWAVRPGQVDVAALDQQPVPTPGTLWLLGAGLLGLSLRWRRWVLQPHLGRLSDAHPAGQSDALPLFHPQPTGSAVRSTTCRSTKLECTPLTPSMRVSLFSSRSW